MMVSRNTATTITPVGQVLTARMFVCALLSTLAACAAGDKATTLGPTAAATPAAAGAQPAKPEPPKKLTATEINQECWMDPVINNIRDLDHRLKLVNKCIDQKTQSQGGL
jgi:hypothetical protein